MTQVQVSLALSALTALILSVTSSAVGEPNENAISNSEWQSIESQAKEIVASESAENTLPFIRNLEAQSHSVKHVFAYYFPFFMISMDNAPPTIDHWAQHYLLRSGEDGHYRDVGGFARERPLPTGPWQSPHWREKNEAIDVWRGIFAGFDGFSVGLQSDEGLTRSISNGVCNAASHSEQNFRIVPVPDGAVLTSASVDKMTTLIKEYLSCQAIYKINGEAVVSPFSPNSETVDYWRQVKTNLAAAGFPVFFLPILIDPGRSMNDFASISDGLSFWGFRSVGDLTDFSNKLMISAMKKLTKTWMQPIISQDFRPKAAMFWESSNTETFRDEWMAAIQSDTTLAQVISWNDYSEATEISPSSKIGFLFYDLSAYYISWFKTGTAPTITRDAIYYDHRDQIFTPTIPPQPRDKVFTRNGNTLTQNAIEMLALLTSPATLRIEIAGKSYEMEAGPGLTAFKVPALVGRPIFKIVRAGNVVLDITSRWQISPTPTALSGLYLGGSSTRDNHNSPD